MAAAGFAPTAGGVATGVMGGGKLAGGSTTRLGDLGGAAAAVRSLSATNHDVVSGRSASELDKEKFICTPHHTTAKSDTEAETFAIMTA